MPDTSTEPGTRNAVLEMIRTGIELRKRGLGSVPSVHTMACWLGCSVPSVCTHLLRLERDGRLRRLRTACGGSAILSYEIPAPNA